jgi:S1-C subfamily serine protease
MPETPWSRKLPPLSPKPGSALPPKPESVSPRFSEPPARPTGNFSEQSVQPPGAGRQSYQPLKAPSSGKSKKNTLSLKKVGFTIGALLALVAVGYFVVSNSDRETLTTQTTIGTSDDSNPTSEETTTTLASNGEVDWDKLSKSVVFIEAMSPCDWRGSGTIVLDGSYILTNQHVASEGECELKIGLTLGLNSSPEVKYFAEVLAGDKSLDLAVLRLVDSSGSPLKISGFDPVVIEYEQPPLGSQLATLGYPALGSYEAGMTITFTSGTFSGIDYTDGEFFKTDAQMRGGVSGGAAFNSKGLFIGIPTAGLIEEESGAPVGINLIRPVKFARTLLAQAEANSNGGAKKIDSSGSNEITDTSSDVSGGYGNDYSTDPRFGTCKEAISNGYGPYYYEIDVEYGWYNDRDNDGIVCER